MSSLSSEISKIIKEELEKVFVYGTLKDKATREKALGHDVKINKAKADNKKVSDYKTYPNLEKGKKEVSGDELYLSSKDVKKLDNWEEHYDRKKVKLENGDEDFVYILKNKFK